MRKVLFFIMLFSDFFQVNLIAEDLPYTTIPAFDVTTKNKSHTKWTKSTFDKPVALVKALKYSNLLFVVEKSGKIKVVNLKKNVVQEEVFLDVSDDISSRQEEGLLDLEFHPNFHINKKFYIYRTVKNKLKNNSRTNRLSEYKVKSIDPFIADSESENIIIDQIDEAWNHNGSDLCFGNDGYLYMSLGDEGGGGDNFKNSQRIDKDFFSGIIRIDVDKNSKNIKPNYHPAIIYDKHKEAKYLIPRDNPWVKVSQFNGKKINENKVRSEFWAVGLRNVWRMSFDSKDGTLWAGDVGQNRFEEINIITKGGNYGWSIMEGKQRFITQNISSDMTKEKNNFINPIWKYGRNDGISVTGGLVYRYDKFPELKGKYIFADFGSGNIWALDFGNQKLNTKIQSSASNLSKKIKVIKIAKSQGISSISIDPRDTGIIMTNYLNNRVELLEKKNSTN